MLLELIFWGDPSFPGTKSADFLAVFNGGRWQSPSLSSSPAEGQLVNEKTCLIKPLPFLGLYPWNTEEAFLKKECVHFDLFKIFIKHNYIALKKMHLCIFPHSGIFLH